MEFISKHNKDFNQMEYMKITDLLYWWQQHGNINSTDKNSILKTLTKQNLQHDLAILPNNQKNTDLQGQDNKNDIIDSGKFEDINYIWSIQRVAHSKKLGHLEYAIWNDQLDSKDADNLLKSVSNVPLTDIDMSDMLLDISPSIINQIVNHKTLKNLCLAHSVFSSVSLQSLAENSKNMPLLEHLNLEFCQFEDKNLIWFLLVNVGRNCPEMQHLNFSNLFAKIGVFTILSFLLFENLVELRCSNNIFTTEAQILLDVAFKNLAKLKTMDLSCCCLSPEGVVRLGRCLANFTPNIAHVNLSYNRIGQELDLLKKTFVNGPSQLGSRLAAMETLTLRWCDMNGGVLCSLVDSLSDHSQKVKSLDVSLNGLGGLTGTFIQTVLSLPALQKLQITGCLPEEQAQQLNKKLNKQETTFTLEI